MKKFLALILAAAQISIAAPMVTASASVNDNVTVVSETTEPQTSTESPTTDDETTPIVSYASDTMTNESGEVYATGTDITSDLKRYGLTGYTAYIWSVQRIASIANIGTEGFRFGTRSPGKSTASTIMNWDFTADTVNTVKEMTEGYIFDTEIAVQVKDTGAYAAMNINGRDSSGSDVKLAQLHFALDGTANKAAANPGSAYAVDAQGNAVGDSVTIKATSDSSYNNAGELLLVRVKLDLVNHTYSAWVVPRKDENGEYSAVEPTDDDIIADNASMLDSGAVSFTGVSFDMANYSYGNCVWIKTAKISEYEPVWVEPTATPTPAPTATPTPVPTATPTPAPTEGHEEDVALKAAVISDLQYGRASQDSSLTNLEYAGKKFKSAVNQLIEKAGGEEQLDALLIAGDITHNSTAEEWSAFVEDLEEVIPQGSHTKVLFLRGNHDAKDNLQDNFVTYLSQYDPTITQANNVYDIYGYKFITVSQDTQRINDESSNYDYIHSPETIEWFTQEVAQASAQAAQEDKPVFVGMHPAVKDTVYGSFAVEGMRNGEAHTSTYWGTTELYDSLKDYSNVIAFSGHSHWDMANERSIYQNEFTALNTGAINNMEIEDCWDESYQPKRFGSNENESSGYYFEVGTDNIVTVHRMDFYREGEFKTPWTINVNDKDNWIYTDSRDTSAPYFTDDAAAEVSNVGTSTARVTFDQAVDDDTDVGHYRLEMINTLTGEADKTYTISSYYWQGADAPEKDYWDVSGLDEETEYKAVITAYDSFYQPSARTLESEPFTTAASEAREVLPAAFTKISFTNEGIQDTSEYARFYGMEPRTYGSVPVSYNSDLKMYEASFSRDEDSTESANFFKVMFDEGRKELMQGSDGYTIDLMFSPSELVDSNNIIGAAQSSGFDIETDSDGVLAAYLRHNGAWVNDPYPGSSLTVEKDKYYHLTVTYDGSVIKVYNDGVLMDSHSASGDIEFYEGDDDNFGMVIGGDYKPVSDGDEYTDQSAAQNAFCGKIVFANIYSGALNSKEVAALDAAYEARKSLEKADELNELLTGGTIDDEELLAEGRALMASENLTDELIEEYIEKVNSGRAVDYKLYTRDIASDYGKAIVNSDYGITANTSGVIWSVTKQNSEDTLYTDALRFSTRTGVGENSIMKINFANDTTDNSDKVVFDNGKYVYESEFSLLYKEEGNADMIFAGTKPDGTTGEIARLRFTVTNNDPYKYTGNAVMIDADGNETGNTIKLQLSNDKGSMAVTLMYLRLEIDLENGVYNAYLVPRKLASAAYEGTEISSETTLAENGSINSDARTFDSMELYYTVSTLTNIMWLNSIEVSGVNSGALTADITTDPKTVLEAGSGTVSAAVNNRSADAAELALLCAQYDESGRLISVTKKDAVFAGGEKGTIDAETTISEDCSRLGLFVWNNDMYPYDAAAADNK